MHSSGGMHSVAAETHYSLAVPRESKRSGQEGCFEIKFEWRYWVLVNTETCF